MTRGTILFYCSYSIKLFLLYVIFYLFQRLKKQKLFIISQLKKLSKNFKTQKFFKNNDFSKASK